MQIRYLNNVIESKNEQILTEKNRKDNMEMQIRYLNNEIESKNEQILTEKNRKYEPKNDLLTKLTERNQGLENDLMIVKSENMINNEKIQELERKLSKKKSNRCSIF